MARIEKKESDRRKHIDSIGSVDLKINLCKRHSGSTGEMRTISRLIHNVSDLTRKML